MKTIKNIEQLIRRLNSISNEELTSKEIKLITDYLNKYKIILNNE